MQWTRFSAGAAGVAIIGYLGLRILDLERQVARLLEEPTGAPALSDEAPTESATPGAISPASATDKARLAALEARMDVLSKHLNSPPALPSLRGPALCQEQAILEVVEGANSRVRDRQLEWHRARWLETRDGQLAAFAVSWNLRPDQTLALRAALELELDHMVAVLKRRDLAEDPDQAAADWKAVLDKTDQNALSVLTPEQQQVWVQVRQLERSVLWPWLPNQTGNQ